MFSLVCLFVLSSKEVFCLYPWNYPKICRRGRDICDLPRQVSRINQYFQTPFCWKSWQSKIGHYFLEFPLAPTTAVSLCLCLCLCFNRFTHLSTRHKHKHKRKKMEKIPFSYAYAYAYVAPGLHCLCIWLWLCLCLRLCHCVNEPTKTQRKRGP